MAVIDFAALREVSGRQLPGGVVEWLKENRIAFVVGGDGMPRTTDDMLPEAIRERLSPPNKEVGR